MGENLNMNCVNCGHSQEIGKFCGKCGSPLNPINNDTATPLNIAAEGHVSPAPNIAQAQQMQQQLRLNQIFM